MKLYVIGNGFDIAHDLKSSYADYHGFVKSHANARNGWSLILDYYPDNYQFWSDAETNICRINRDLYLGLKQTYGHALLDVLLDKIRESFAEFIIEIETRFMDLEPRFTLDPDALYVSFNYTSVLETVYGVPKDRIVYLHNTVGDSIKKRRFLLEANELIMGHSPDYSNFFFYQDSPVGSDREYVSFRNKTVKNTTEIIQKTSLVDVLSGHNNISEVVFYGFSLSPNDADYVQTIATCLQLPSTRFKVYYHVDDGEDEEKVKERFFRNMMRCAFDITKTEMRRCNGVDCF